MANLICEKCKCKCLLYTLSCLYDSVTLLNAALDSEKVKAAMDSAQMSYVKPLLGDCFDELCTALTNSQLPDSDENYAVLETKWSDLLDQVQELTLVATEYIYVSRVSFGSLKKSGITFPDGLDKELFLYLLQGRKAEIGSLQAILTDWLNDNSDIYTCVDSSSTCADNLLDEMDIPFTNWTVTSGRGR